MNIQQAKKIPLSDFLSMLGFQPASTKRGELWYASPLRQETNPSFKVNPATNRWHDFGEGQGGDILDFIQQYDRISGIPAALSRIGEIMGGDIPSPPYRPPPERTPIPAEIQLDCVGPLESEVLRAYVASRGIDLATADGRIFEAHYRCDGRAYFAVAFPSRSGGYEIRNSSFKGSIGKKDIAIVPGSPDRIAIFEGFFDYLSLLKQRGGTIDAAVVVLNSVGLKDRAVEYIRQHPPGTVELYRDNDDAGLKLLESFRAGLPGVEILDMAPSYAGFRDLNERLASASQMAR